MLPGEPGPLGSEGIELTPKQVVAPQRVAFSPFGMISTAHYLATEVGVAVLSEGGNAFDAAVAAAFALCVCEPQASGLGGQTMMIAHIAEPRRTFVLDGSSRAPHRAIPQSVSKPDRRRGYRAATVPSTPAVLGYVLDRYGTVPLAAAIAPSIQLAEEGFEVSVLQHALIKRERRFLQAGPAAHVFLRKGRRTPPVGARLRQPALAETLRRLASAGIEDFYTGRIARRIHEDMAANDGLLRDDDLAQIPWPIERRAISTRFAGRRVRTFPPPGAGRVLIEMLNILQEFDPKLPDPDLPRGALLLAEVMRRGALDRQDRPFDPNFYAQVVDKQMTCEDYAKRISRRIRRRLRTHGETTHLSVMDRFGNVVALTQSIESVFGSCVMTPELGFLYNNYMGAFEHDVIGHPYYMRPNAVPWASVAPTIVFRRRKPVLAIGSPGSDRIVTAILQVLLRLGTHTPEEAVSAPRLHCSADGRVSLEASRFRDDIPRALERRGFRVEPRDPFSFYMGCVQMVMRDKKGFIGVADPRRDGSAAGPLA